MKKKPSVVAKNLASPRYHQRVVPNKKKEVKPEITEED